MTLVMTAVRRVGTRIHLIDNSRVAEAPVPEFDPETVQVRLQSLRRHTGRRTTADVHQGAGHSRDAWTTAATALRRRLCQFIDAEITGSRGYDLLARPLVDG
jgi:hypothetical protein